MSKKSILLSIVTPTYNRGYTLRNNFASVMAQRLTNIEHIIIDGFSSDDTKSIVEGYQKSAPYPVIYRQFKSTAYEAMNEGIKLSRGKWIHILNSDDTYAFPDALNHMFKTKNTDRYDIVACPIIVDTNNTETIWKPKYDKKLRFHNFPHPGTIIAKSFYTTYGLYDTRFKIVADAIYNLRYYHNANILTLDKPLVRMSGTKGLSTRQTFRLAIEKSICIGWYHRFAFNYTITGILNVWRVYLLAKLLHK